MNWALILGLYLGDVIKGSALVLDLLLNPYLKPDIWARVLDPRAYYFKSHQLPPEPLAKAGVGKGYIASDIEFLLIYRDLLINIVSLN